MIPHRLIKQVIHNKESATATRQMLYSMLVASGTFFIMYYLFYQSMGNHALWMAFLWYLSLRGGMQWVLWRLKK